MNLKSILTALLCWLCFAGFGKEVYWTPENLPMVHLQDARRYVCNPDGILSQEAVDSLDRELALLEKETGVQTVAIVVGHIEGDDPYSFGQALADKYGIGHKGRDDGLIVLLCTLDRSYSILTGDGLEGVLPDVVCHRVEQNVMVPLLKEGEWSEAMLATIHALDRCIRQDPEMSAYTQSEEEDDWLPGLLAILTMGGLFAFGLHKSKQKCPKCGKRKMKRVHEEFLKSNGNKIFRTTYICKKCGHTFHHDMDADFTPSSGGGSSYSGGGWFGGGSSYSGGSSSYSGGSFGGGHFGGGGASGRF